MTRDKINLLAALLLVTAATIGYFNKESLFGDITTLPLEQQDCFPQPIKYETDEYRLFRFLAKLEKTRGTEYWDNPTIQRVLTNGEPDMEKIKVLFQERSVTSNFDAAAAQLPTISGKVEISKTCLDRFDAIEVERAKDIQAVYQKATSSEAIKNKEY